ncbi:MAG TPA: hypothetical protein VHV30_13905, partial [Polyangiaceae bacterium]|nr:hypothetical protein [Polyangiaceae bacterium]
MVGRQSSHDFSGPLGSLTPRVPSSSGSPQSGHDSGFFDVDILYTEALGQVMHRAQTDSHLSGLSRSKKSHAPWWPASTYVGKDDGSFAAPPSPSYAAPPPLPSYAAPPPLLPSRVPPPQVQSRVAPPPLPSYAAPPPFPSYAAPLAPSYVRSSYAPPPVRTTPSHVPVAYAPRALAPLLEVDEDVEIFVPYGRGLGWFGIAVAWLATMTLGATLATSVPAHAYTRSHVHVFTTAGVTPASTSPGAPLPSAAVVVSDTAWTAVPVQPSQPALAAPPPPAPAAPIAVAPPPVVAIPAPQRIVKAAPVAPPPPAPKPRAVPVAAAAPAPRPPVETANAAPPRA